MSEETSQVQIVYWPRVKEILDGIMGRWIERWERQPLPGIHAYFWETSQELQVSVLSGLRAIEPGQGRWDLWEDAAAWAVLVY